MMEKMIGMKVSCDYAWSAPRSGADYAIIGGDGKEDYI